MATRIQKPPQRWRKEIDFVLISQEQLARRVRALARQIQKDYAGRDLVIVALLNGTVVFLADLLRDLSLPLRLDFIGVSSYGGGTESADLVFTKELRLDVSGRDVLVVDDILDTGKTLLHVMTKLRKLRPRRMRVCVLLDKPSRRIEPVSAHYIGFQIPNHFVVGYGLDYAERYRNLPFVGVLHPEMYKDPDFIPLLSEKKRQLLLGVKEAEPPPAAPLRGPVIQPPMPHASRLAATL